MTTTELRVNFNYDRSKCATKTIHKEGFSPSTYYEVDQKKEDDILNVIYSMAATLQYPLTDIVKTRAGWSICFRIPEDRKEAFQNMLTVWFTELQRSHLVLNHCFA